MPPSRLTGLPVLLRRGLFVGDQQIAAAHAAVGCFAPHHTVVAAHGELMLLALTAIGEGVLANRVEFESVGAFGFDAEHAFHHPFPLFPVRRHATEVFPRQ